MRFTHRIPCPLTWLVIALVVCLFPALTRSVCGQVQTSQNMPQSAAKQQRFELGDERLKVILLADVDAMLPGNNHFELRFDRSATITDVTAYGRHLINGWGMPDEFGQIGIGVLGFDDAKPGESFIKPGVGVLEMIDSGSYKSGTAFPVKQWITTHITHDKNQVTVTQSSPIIRGYGYQLTKHYTITPDTGTIQIQYTLTNTGKMAWAIEHYNHNFFSLNNQPLGPNWQVTLGRPIPSIPLHWLKMQDKQLHITMEPKSYGFIQVNEPLTPTEADLSINSIDSQMTINMSGDTPAYRMAWFFSPTSLCPERFHLISLQPEQSKQWTLWYRFTSEKFK